MASPDNKQTAAPTPTTGGSKETKQWDPLDPTEVKHTEIGVWDFYKQRSPSWRPKFRSFTLPFNLGSIVEHAPLLWRLLKDIVSIHGVLPLACVYLVCDMVLAVLPATQLWYDTEVINGIQRAMASQGSSEDIHSLWRAIYFLIGCKTASRLLRSLQSSVDTVIARTINDHFTWKTLRARLLLDLPTFNTAPTSLTASVQGNSPAWDFSKIMFHALTTITQFVTEFSVIALVLVRIKEREMLLAIFLMFMPHLLPTPKSWTEILFSTWAATTHNEFFLTMAGIGEMSKDKKYRQELVAGNLQSYLASVWKAGMDHIGYVPNDFYHELMGRTDSYHHVHSAIGTLSSTGSELLLFATLLRSPSQLAFSWSSFQITRQAIQSLLAKVTALTWASGEVQSAIANIRKLYDLPNLTNLVVDGTKPWPENKQSLREGIEVEFRNVSFKYPDSEHYVLKDLSFKVERGQLCVIVGTNGSGKSTLLKLLLRLYDPESGIILIDGLDIRTLRISDVRRAISVLFQDYVIYPLSIAKNISLGCPPSDTFLEHDSSLIERAAELADATSVISKLPNGFESFIHRPVHDYFGMLPEGTKSLFGRKDLKFYGNHGQGYVDEQREVSGGEGQRLALARSFMRQVAGEDDVGMLLFDEPSASLDPEAEYALFERLRSLRGSKTMLFSSHRFGNLTKHADLILYMRDGEVLERGKHRELLGLNGGYASMYKVQAQSFLDDN